MNATPEAVGQNIRQFRERLGFSQATVAAYLGLAREQVSYYETGNRPVPTDHLQRLADLFGIDAYDLLETETAQQQLNVALAFRADALTPDDLKNLAAFQRIVSNYRKMRKRLPDGH
jgi:transcriptional regulator with XRE-family HTH domain